MGFIDFTTNQHVSGLQVRKGALYPQRTPFDDALRQLTDPLDRECYLNPKPIDLAGAIVSLGKTPSTLWPSMRGRVFGVWAITVIDRDNNVHYAFADSKGKLTTMHRKIQHMILKANRTTLSAR